jgi:hypothetical protein
VQYPVGHQDSGVVTDSRLHGKRACSNPILSDRSVDRQDRNFQ